MDLYTIGFILFLLTALAVYYAVGRWAKRGQWVVLLVASLAFYAVSGWQNLAFIGVTALSTWAGGRAFGALEAKSKAARKAAESRDEKKAIKKQFTRKKRWVLVAMLLINFGILAYLKYAEVIVGYLAPESHWTVGILLPLGISFYTFQSISYVIDTYNGKYEPEGNFARYLLFVSFFPQLIQGPINRFDLLAHQLYERHSFDGQEARRAVLQIGYGLFKKYAIANALFSTVDVTFSHIDPSTPGSMIVFGILAYSAYQYADFSGGIDMVLGVARLFGIQMSPNFRQPYFSVSLADFWRRWHITLGAWMRDYVFYPFALLPGVTRWGKHLTKHFGKHIGRTLPACVANIIVFFIVGLWHGAQTHFILWGIYNGLVIALSDLFVPAFQKLATKLKINVKSGGYHVFAIVRTFVVVNIGWYFDAIPDFGSCMQAFHNTVFNFNLGGFMTSLKWLSTQFGISHYWFCYSVAAIGIVFVFVVSLLKERGVDVTEKVLGLPVVVRGALYTCVLFVTLFAMIYGTGGGFMYANF